MQFLWRPESIAWPQVIPGCRQVGTWLGRRRPTVRSPGRGSLSPVAGSRTSAFGARPQPVECLHNTLQSCNWTASFTPFRSTITPASHLHPPHSTHDQQRIQTQHRPHAQHHLLNICQHTVFVCPDFSFPCHTNQVLPGPNAYALL